MGRKVIASLLLLLYGLTVMHVCHPHGMSHGWHEQMGEGAIFTDDDGCYVHSEDGVHECHHENNGGIKHQHSKTYTKADLSGPDIQGGTVLEVGIPTDSYTADESASATKRQTYISLYWGDVAASCVPVRGGPAVDTAAERGSRA